MVQPPHDRTRLEELTREECMRLVAQHSIGRLAYAVPGTPPVVLPLNYVVDEDIIVFRSDPGTKLDMASRVSVSFQVDSYDPAHRTGWSVLIRGIAVEADGAELAHLHLEPWAGGDKEHWVRVLPFEVSGRRILLGDVVVDERGYL
jgi:nitroimidazol reductase NimA-like FMN-containing flavoprotein (pyridoxamine 5'-phosphate oxidase superfamily)